MNNVLRISCTRSNLKVARDFIAHFLAPYNPSSLVLNQVILAVDEVVANIIIHGNAEDESRFLTLRLRLQNQELMVEIEDESAITYIPSSYQEPNLLEFIRQGKKGGVGMTLVNRIMDRVEYVTQDSHNMCRLYKKLA